MPTFPNQQVHLFDAGNQWTPAPTEKLHEGGSPPAKRGAELVEKKQYQDDRGEVTPVPPQRRGSTASLMEGFLRTAQLRKVKHIPPSLETEIPPAKKQSYAPLSLTELETFLTEQEVGALKNYIQHGGGISYAMRNKIPLTAEQKEMLAHIQSALKKIRERGGAYPGLLHRGMSAGYGPRDNSHVQLFKEGKKFEELGLMSASSDSDFVDGWHSGIKLTVADPHNGDISALNPDQMEALCEPAKYDVLLAAFDRTGALRALISEEGVPPESGKAKRHQSSYESHLIRPVYELHGETGFLSGKIPSDPASQRSHLIMNLTLGFNSTLTTENFRSMYRRLLPTGTSAAADPVLKELRKIFRGRVTTKTPVEVAAALAPLLGTEKMETLLKSLDGELRHLKEAAAVRDTEQSHEKK